MVLFGTVRQCFPTDERQLSVFHTLTLPRHYQRTASCLHIVAGRLVSSDAAPVYPVLWSTSIGQLMASVSSWPDEPSRDVE